MSGDNIVDALLGGVGLSGDEQEAIDAASKVVDFDSFVNESRTYLQGVVDQTSVTFQGIDGDMMKAAEARRALQVGAAAVTLHVLTVAEACGRVDPEEMTVQQAAMWGGMSALFSTALQIFASTEPLLQVGATAAAHSQIVLGMAMCQSALSLHERAEFGETLGK